MYCDHGLTKQQNYLQYVSSGLAYVGQTWPRLVKYGTNCCAGPLYTTSPLDNMHTLSKSLKTSDRGW